MPLRHQSGGYRRAALLATKSGQERARRDQRLGCTTPRTPATRRGSGRGRSWNALLRGLQSRATMRAVVFIQSGGGTCGGGACGVGACGGGGARLEPKGNFATTTRAARLSWSRTSSAGRDRGPGSPRTITSARSTVRTSRACSTSSALHSFSSWALLVLCISHLRGAAGVS